MEDVIIIGAGLSGLSAAYYLKQKGINALILEARERIGGRIFTLPVLSEGAPVEMGATWFADKHTYLMHLVKKLNLTCFTQYQKGISIYQTSFEEPPQLFTVPDSEPPSYRIAGGTATILERLVEEIGKEKVLLNVQVSQLSEKNDFIELKDKKGNSYSARQVISTLPPNLLGEGITFMPALPEDILFLMQQTHTWMGEATKFALVYASPFWRNKGYSGMLLSQVNIATEVYDHTNFEENHFALKGFLAANAAALPKVQRVHLIVEQLKNLLGEEAGAYLSYHEKVWVDDTYTYAGYKNFVLPHQNSGHALYQQTFMNHKLYISGSETSPYFGGYMDGAVYSGLRTAISIIDFFETTR